MRGRCPIFHDEMMGSYVLTRYNDIRPLVSDRTLLRDPLNGEPEAMAKRFGAEALAEALAGVRSENSSILTLDDPDHARIRQPLAQALYARVAKFKPEVERIVSETMDRIDASQPFDLMSTFCVPIPIDVIASILGVDGSRLVEFRAWSEGIIQTFNMFRSPEQTKVMEECSEALNDYFTRLIEEKHANPRRRFDQRHGAAAGGRPGGQRHRAAHQPVGAADRRQPHHHRPDRQRGAAVAAEPGRAGQAEGRSRDHQFGGRGSAALRAAGRHHRPRRLARHGGRRMSGETEAEPHLLPALGQPATPRCSTIRTVSMSAASTSRTSRSAAGRTSASARRWPGSRRRSPWCGCSSASPNLRLANPDEAPVWRTLPFFPRPGAAGAGGGLRSTLSRC
ncbi:MAG: hypothetical protein WDM85_15450 [Caulobacteraceae bacterium]